MSAVQVKLKPLHAQMGKTIAMPARMTDQAAGYDLAAAIDAPLVLQPGARAMVGCGFALQLPPGYEVQIRPRSGLAAKHGITILNAPGTIDADYRGEVRVLLINHGQQAYTLEPGCRIAQMVLGRLVDVALQTVSSLDDSDRGASGFGSTGS